jgi:hypothetical protein
MMQASAGGSDTRSEMSGVASRRTDVIVSATESPLNARSPLTISYSTAPTAKMSVRWSTGSPRICSGDM